MILKNELENKENIKLLILDIDGTLVRFTNLEALMDRVLKEINEEKNDKQFTKYVTAVADILKDSEKSLSFDFKTLCKYINHQKVLKRKAKTPIFLKKMIDYESEYVEEVEGAYEFLEEASHKKQIVCSTNWFESSQRKKLEKFNLSRFITNIYTCEHNISKPSIYHFLHILNNEMISPEEAIMIGDSKTDLPDKKLKLQSILYDPNNEKENLYEKADCVITELTDINKILGFHQEKTKSIDTILHKNKKD